MYTTFDLTTPSAYTATYEVLKLSKYDLSTDGRPAVVLSNQPPRTAFHSKDSTGSAPSCIGPSIDNRACEEYRR